MHPFEKVGAFRITYLILGTGARTKYGHVHTESSLTRKGLSLRSKFLRTPPIRRLSPKHNSAQGLAAYLNYLETFHEICGAGSGKYTSSGVAVGECNSSPACRT